MNERTRTQPSVGVSMANEILQPTMAVYGDGGDGENEGAKRHYDNIASVESHFSTSLWDFNMTHCCLGRSAPRFSIICQLIAARRARNQLPIDCFMETRGSD